MRQYPETPIPSEGNSLNEDENTSNLEKLVGREVGKYDAFEKGALEFEKQGPELPRRSTKSKKANEID